MEQPYSNLLSKLEIKEKLISIKEGKANENATRNKYYNNYFFAS